MFVDLQVEERTENGHYAYTVRTSDGCRYILISRKRKLYDAVRKACAEGNEQRLYDVMLEIASKVLRSHDVCFDTLELI